MFMEALYARALDLKKNFENEFKIQKIIVWFSGKTAVGN